MPFSIIKYCPRCTTPLTDKNRLYYKDPHYRGQVNRRYECPKCLLAFAIRTFTPKTRVQLTHRHITPCGKYLNEDE